MAFADNSCMEKLRYSSTALTWLLDTTEVWKSCVTALLGYRLPVTRCCNNRLMYVEFAMDIFVNESLYVMFL